MMYYAWKIHHILPSVFFNLGKGTKTILQAFAIKEAEEAPEEGDE